MQKYTQETFARLISLIFSPMAALFALTACYCRRYSGSQSEFFKQIAFILSIFIIIIILRLVLVKCKYSSDWDMSDVRKRRMPLLVLTGLLYGVSHAFSPFFPDAFTHLWYVLLIWLFGFTLITLFWKISGHVGANALALCFLIYWFGWILWWVIFIIPIVAWSRIKLKKHTIVQTVVGTLYSLLVFLFSIKLQII